MSTKHSGTLGRISVASSSLQVPHQSAKALAHKTVEAGRNEIPCSKLGLLCVPYQVTVTLWLWSGMWLALFKGALLTLVLAESGCDHCCASLAFSSSALNW